MAVHLTRGSERLHIPETRSIVSRLDQETGGASIGAGLEGRTPTPRRHASGFLSFFLPLPEQQSSLSEFNLLKIRYYTQRHIW